MELWKYGGVWNAEKENSTGRVLFRIVRGAETNVNQWPLMGSCKSFSSRRKFPIAASSCSSVVNLKHGGHVFISVSEPITEYSRNSEVIVMKHGL